MANTILKIAVVVCLILLAISVVSSFLMIKEIKKADRSEDVVMKYVFEYDYKNTIWRKFECTGLASPGEKDHVVFDIYCDSIDGFMAEGHVIAENSIRAKELVELYCGSKMEELYGQRK